MRLKYLISLLLFLLPFSIQGQPNPPVVAPVNPSKSIITVNPNQPPVLTVDPNTPIYTPVDPNKVLIDPRKGNVLISTHSFPQEISYAYVPNRGSNTVSVINLANNTKVTDISVGIEPNGVAITPDGKYVFVTNYYSEYSNYYSSYGPSLLSVIDTSTNTKIKDIYVGAGARGVAVVNTGESLKVYVANYLSNTVSAIDGKSLIPIKQIPVGNKPFGVAVKDGRTVYVTNSNENTIYTSSISVIDTSLEKEVRVIPTFYLSNAKSIAVNPFSFQAYMTAYNDDGKGGVYAFDTTNDQFMTDIGLGGLGASEGLFPSSVAITPFGYSRLYVAYEQNSTIVDIHRFYYKNDYNFGPYEKEVITDISNQPRGLAFTPDGKRLYVVNHGSNSVSVINTEDDSKIKEIPVGSGPEAVGNFIGPKMKPEVKFVPDQLDFSSTKKGETSPTKEVVLTNQYVPVKIVRFELPTYFTQTNNCGSLKVGESCKVSVVFQPTADYAPGGEMKAIDEWGRSYAIPLAGIGGFPPKDSPGKVILRKL